jgi:hypothetical protein
MFRILSTGELNVVIADAKRSFLYNWRGPEEQDRPVRGRPVDEIPREVHNLLMRPGRTIGETNRGRDPERHREELRESTERAVEEQFERMPGRTVEEIPRNESGLIGQDLDGKSCVYVDRNDGTTYNCDIVVNGTWKFMYPILAEVITSVNINGEFNPNIIICKRQTAKKLVYWKTYNFIDEFNAEILNKSNLHLINKRNVESYAKRSIEKFEKKAADLASTGVNIVPHVDKLLVQRDRLLSIIRHDKYPNIVACSNTIKSFHGITYYWPVYSFVNLQQAKKIVYWQKNSKYSFKSLNKGNIKFKTFKGKGYRNIGIAVDDHEANVSRDAPDIDNMVVRGVITHRESPEIETRSDNIEELPELPRRPSFGEMYNGEAYRPQQPQIHIEDPPFIATIRGEAQIAQDGVEDQDGPEQDGEEGQHDDGGENRNPAIRIHGNTVERAAPIGENEEPWEENQDG